jgi:hypothetical protein
MLDPKEQAKGGFRAQLERQREGQNVILGGADVAAEKAPEGTPTPSEHQADGADGADGADASSPADTTESTTPSARRPKRWH